MDRHAGLREQRVDHEAVRRVDDLVLAEVEHHDVAVERRALADLADQLVLAERLVPFDAQALRPRPREVLLEVPIDGRGHDHRDDRPERRERHVLLRVPRITLRAEVGGAEVAAEG